jgi:hypothetical protein
LVQSRINRGRARREDLRIEAEERVSARASRSNAEQIALLDSRLGLGVGAIRERLSLGKVEEVVDGTSKKTKDTSKKTKSGPKKSRRDRRKSKASRHQQRRNVDKSDDE